MKKPYYILKVDDKEIALRIKRRGAIEELSQISDNYMKSGTLLQIFCHESNGQVDLVWESIPTHLPDEENDNLGYWAQLVKRA
jgi:hypothetical protein